MINGSGEFEKPQFDIGTPTVRSSWDYPTFRDYLLRLAKSRRSVLPEASYPDKIQLSPAWHEVLNKIRGATVEDGKEHFALIGYRNNATSLLLHATPVVGGELKISGSVIDEHVRKAKESEGLEGKLGDIHSHQGDVGRIAFSCSDLYTMLTPDKPDWLLGLVQGRQHLFAFRVRETVNVPAFEILSQESFKGIWRASGVSFKMNQDIAKRHGLVFYRGRPDEPLVKVTGPFVDIFEGQIL